MVYNLFAAYRALETLNSIISDNPITRPLSKLSFHLSICRESLVYNSTTQETARLHLTYRLLQVAAQKSHLEIMWRRKWN